MPNGTSSSNTEVKGNKLRARDALIVMSASDIKFNVKWNNSNTEGKRADFKSTRAKDTGPMREQKRHEHGTVRGGNERLLNRNWSTPAATPSHVFAAASITGDHYCRATNRSTRPPSRVTRSGIYSDSPNSNLTAE
ncbi:unnamed protein product, partial [Iphiclides podalirius]